MSNATPAEAIFADLCESDEVTSPAEYPDHVLVDLKGLTRLLEKHAGWHPMADAPHDGTSVLLCFKRDLRQFDTSEEFRLERWQGLQFVGRHHGFTRNDYDMGWAFAAPVGQGGFPDAWLAGWQPLPMTEEA